MDKILMDKILEPLYMPILLKHGFSSIHEMIIVYTLYRRACQRWYGDSRVDHI
jgi:hypothetical protein